MTSLPSGVEKITVGGSHACAMFGGNVACWGSNFSGQLGVETGTCAGSSTSTARRPCNVDLPQTIPTLANVVDVRANHNSTGVLVTAGGGLELSMWGGFDGYNCEVSSGSPYPCDAMEAKTPLSSTVAAFAFGWAHGCFLATVPGGVRCWGANGAGQLGGNTAASDVAIAVPGLSNATSIVSGDDQSCALRSDGSVVCWGANEYAQLGIGSASTKAPPTPVVGLTDAIGLAAGSTHTCAVSGDGTVRCWGSNGYGQLGAPSVSKCESYDCAMTPVVVSGL